MQKIFVFLTLLCASLSGSGVVADPKLEYIESLQTAYDDSQHKLSLANQKEKRGTSSTSILSSKKQGHSSLLTKLNLGFFDGDKQGLEFGEDSDPSLVSNYTNLNLKLVSGLNSRYAFHSSVSSYSSNGIRAPPVSLS